MGTVTFPFQQFVDPSTDKAISLGSVYIGEVNKDPRDSANQKPITLSTGNSTVSGQQPVPLSVGGVPLYNGDPCNIEVDGSYSIAVVNSSDEQVYYVPFVVGTSSAVDEQDDETIYYANSLSASLDDYVIIYDAGGANPAPVSLTVTATSTGFTDPVYRFDGSSFGSGNTYAYAAPTTKSGTSDTITIEASESDNPSNILATDSLSVYFLQADEEGYTVFLTNEVVNIPTDSDGIVTDYSGTGTEIRVFYGTTELNSISSGGGLSDDEFQIESIVPASITAGTVDVDSGNAAIVSAASAMTSDSATIQFNIKARVNGAESTFNRTQTINKNTSSVVSPYPEGATGESVDFVRLRQLDQFSAYGEVDLYLFDNWVNFRRVSDGKVFARFSQLNGNLEAGVGCFDPDYTE